MGAVISILSAQFLISPRMGGSRIAGQLPKQQCPFFKIRIPSKRFVCWAYVYKIGELLLLLWLLWRDYCL